MKNDPVEWIMAIDERDEGRVHAQVALLACDAQQSVLVALNQGGRDDAVYAPYGHRQPRQHGAQQAFNGELPDPSTGHYLLGNGYRAYNPVLMRFNQPDSWSPFGAGGLNPYVYCLGNPINRRDPTGHMAVGGLLGLMDVVPMAAQESQGDSGGSSPLPWIMAGLGVLSVLGVARLIHWRRMRAAQTEPLDLRTRRPSVSPGPSTSSASLQRQPQERVQAVQLTTQQRLEDAINSRNSQAFLEIASIKGNGMKARFALDDLLPLRESRLGDRPLGLWISDVKTIRKHARRPSQEGADLQLPQFLDVVEEYLLRRHPRVSTRRAMNIR